MLRRCLIQLRGVTKAKAPAGPVIHSWRYLVQPRLSTGLECPASQQLLGCFCPLPNPATYSTASTRSSSLLHLPSPPTPRPHPMVAAAAAESATVLKEWQALLQGYEDARQSPRVTTGGKIVAPAHNVADPSDGVSLDGLHNRPASSQSSSTGSKVGTINATAGGTLAAGSSGNPAVSGDVLLLREAMRGHLSALLHIFGRSVPGGLLPDGVASVFARFYRTVLLPQDRPWFFRTLCSEMGVQAEQVEPAIQQWHQAAATAAGGEPGASPDILHRAAERLATVSRPLYRQLFLPVSQQPHGMQLLVDIRADLLEVIRQQPAYAAPLRALAEQLRQSLAEWFSVGLLQLRHITWEESSAKLLEKLMQYEAVHPIHGWSDLRQRLGPNRRVFAFFHPALPGEPLVVLHTALLEGQAPAAIADILGQGVTAPPLEAPQTAAFYSISSTQAGLAGVELGHSLIKRVAQLLLAEFPSITSLVTLSPIPNFRLWLEAKLSRELAGARATAPVQTGGTAGRSRPQGTVTFAATNAASLIGLPPPSTPSPAAPPADGVVIVRSSAQDSPLLLAHEEAELCAAAEHGGSLHGVVAPAAGGGSGVTGGLQLLQWLLEEDRWLCTGLEPLVRHTLTRLAARYLLLERRRNLALDPVANFHLRNGAEVLRLNWRGDMSTHGLLHSYGLLVNYNYNFARVADNNQSYLVDHGIAAHSQMVELISPAATGAAMAAPAAGPQLRLSGRDLSRL